MFNAGEANEWVLFFIRAFSAKAAHPLFGVGIGSLVAARVRDYSKSDKAYLGRV
jgi:hypothetical protein